MSETSTHPVIPLRQAVFFPGVTAPIAAGRPGTLRAVEAALETEEKLVFVVAQQENVDEPRPEVLHTVGTVASIMQVQRGPSGMQLLLNGEHRAVALRMKPVDDYLEAVVRRADEIPPQEPEGSGFTALYREARERAAELGQKAGLPQQAVQRFLADVEDAGAFSDLVAAYTDMELPERQELLETFSVEERLRRVLLHMRRQIEILDAQQDIKSRVQEELGDMQREMILRQQLKAIRSELGEGDDSGEVDELAERLSELELPAEVREEVDRELARLRRMGPQSQETQVVRTFLETVAELPWTERSEERLDLDRAEGILEEDHYGLSDVKDRILEFLAVRKLRERRASAAGDAGAASAPEAEPDAAGDPDAAEVPGNDDDRAPKGQILLFVGPPGVGKTSIARSIARSIGREYVRISLGGVRDEADIRGHRRTYVGAMPGRIVQGMKQAGTRNPVFLLDEVDKLGVSFQGDPASALLEVLDPAQNDSFTDHYLGVPYDLSEVLFIATANFLQNIPEPLLDRMERIDFSGYTEGEKLEIAKRYLVPRRLDEAGLSRDELTIADEAVATLVSGYTREAGVRQLEREIGRLARKVARRVATGECERMEVDSDMVRELLGRPKVHPERAATADQTGVATGMYYTPTGGDIMFVEASPMPGKGELVLTGQLGDVMKESARAAWTYAKAHAEELGIDSDAFSRDVHVHVPAGAIPKDGPSAGVTMATALVSALAGRPARHDLAMTGEITLSGRVLPIGGVKEKVLGAIRAGITHVVLPAENEADLDDLPEEARDKIEAHPVSHLGEALALALRGGAYREGRLSFGAGDDARGAEAARVDG